MHARCETDPLDFATDLCQHCGGEHCDDHLVYPYGAKRPPLCTSCAIAVGGVRSGAAVVRKRSRGQVKRRRAELRSVQHERRATSFEFFEADAPFPTTDPGPVDDPAPAPTPAAAGTCDELPASRPEADVVPEPAGRRSLLWRRRRSADTTLPAAPDPEPAAEPRLPLGANLPDPRSARTSAEVLLTRLRESGAVPSSIERRGRNRVDVRSRHQDPDDELPPGWATPAQDPAPMATGDGAAAAEAVPISAAADEDRRTEEPSSSTHAVWGEHIDVEVGPGVGPADGGPWVPPALRGVDQPRTARLPEADETDPAALGSTFGGAIASHPAAQPQGQPTPPAGVDDDDDPWAGVPPALRGGWRPTEF